MEQQEFSLTAGIQKWYSTLEDNLAVFYEEKLFSGGSVGKESACWRLGFDSWVRKIPWKGEWQPTPVFLPEEFHGQGSLAGYSPWGRKESNTAELLTLMKRNTGLLCPPVIMLLCIYTNEKLTSSQNLHINIYNIFIYNCQKLDQPRCLSIAEWINKLVVYPYNRSLHSNKKKWVIMSQKDMEVPWLWSSQWPKK